MISYEGNLTRLRPLRRSDQARTLAWRNDPETRENILGYRFPVTEVMEEKWYETALDDQSRTRVIFAIEARDSGALAGMIHLNNIDWIARHAHFGITIGEPDQRGRGLGPDAMTVLFTYAFECLNLRKICLEVAAYNQPAVSLYARYGFSEEGRLRDHVFLEGRYHDVIMMGLFATDFRRRNNTAAAPAEVMA
ncbi:MAG: GNAT family protein [Candidatus Krumholzibacteria bacterium]|nr:GNAT family protein [Candidatus Krumholzibacteria bacterium]